MGGNRTGTGRGGDGGAGAARISKGHWGEMGAEWWRQVTSEDIEFAQQMPSVAWLVDGVCVLWMGIRGHRLQASDIVCFRIMTLLSFPFKMFKACGNEALVSEVQMPILNDSVFATDHASQISTKQFRKPVKHCTTTGTPDYFSGFLPPSSLMKFCRWIQLKRPTWNSRFLAWMAIRDMVCLMRGKGRLAVSV